MFGNKSRKLWQVATEEKLKHMGKDIDNLRRQQQSLKDKSVEKDNELEIYKDFMRELIGAQIRLLVKYFPDEFANKNQSDEDVKPPKS